MDGAVFDRDSGCISSLLVRQPAALLLLRIELEYVLILTLYNDGCIPLLLLRFGLEQTLWRGLNRSACRRLISGIWGP